MFGKMLGTNDPLMNLATMAVFVIYILTYIYTDSIGTSFLVSMGWYTFFWWGIWLYRKMEEEKFRKSDISIVDEMNGKQFDRYLKYLFKFHGYKIESSKMTSESEAELVVTQGENKIVVQAKKYDKNLGIEVVEQAEKSMEQNQAGEVWVVTNREYTSAAYNQVKKTSKVRLINRSKLNQWIINGIR